VRVHYNGARNGRARAGADARTDAAPAAPRRRARGRARGEPRRQPAADLEGADELARALHEPTPPEHGAEFETLLELLFERAVPKSFNAAGPGYLAYIPGGGLFAAALADLIANSVNRYTGLWRPAPALVQLEVDAVRWLCGFVGYGSGSGGILTSGGSLANLSALVTARRERLGEDFSKGTLYASDQVHHSVLKAALLAGFPERHVRQVPSDALFRLCMGALEAQVRADRAAGLTPFLIVANGGSTNTGAVDDLEALADLAARERLALHVDAAYGGFFALTERGRRALHGLERADSITLDPHKGLFLPYGNGALLVKDVSALRRAHAVHAAYLPEAQVDPERVDFADLARSTRSSTWRVTPHSCRRAEVEE
jgi:aromatic-L-amino-acid decarboxylase